MFSSQFKKTLVILVVMALLCLSLAHYDSSYPGSRAAVAVRETLAPLQGRVMLAWQGASFVAGYFRGMNRLQEENDQLQQQLRDLTWKNDSLQEYVYENQLLNNLLNFKQRNDVRFTLLGARAISRSPSNWYSSLVVDRGSADGVKKDMVVVSDAGVVGRIDAVGPHTSDVLLILDQEGAAGAVVVASGTQGVVEGNKEDPGMLRMIDLPYDAKLTPGQAVVTSGLGGIFPGDLPIGEISEFDSSGGELDKYALVSPYVDFDRLEDLFIITGSR